MPSQHGHTGRCTTRLLARLRRRYGPGWAPVQRTIWGTNGTTVPRIVPESDSENYSQRIVAVMCGSSELKDRNPPAFSGLYSL